MPTFSHHGQQAQVYATQCNRHTAQELEKERERINRPCVVNQQSTWASTGCNWALSTGPARMPGMRACGIQLVVESRASYDANWTVGNRQPHGGTVGGGAYASELKGSGSNSECCCFADILPTWSRQVNVTWLLIRTFRIFKQNPSWRWRENLDLWPSGLGSWLTVVTLRNQILARMC